MSRASGGAGSPPLVASPRRLLASTRSLLPKPSSLFLRSSSSLAAPSASRANQDAHFLSAHPRLPLLALSSGTHVVVVRLPDLSLPSFMTAFLRGPASHPGSEQLAAASALALGLADPQALHSTEALRCLKAALRRLVDPEARDQAAAASSLNALQDLVCARAARLAVAPKRADAATGITRQLSVQNLDPAAELPLVPDTLSLEAQAGVAIADTLLALRFFRQAFRAIAALAAHRPPNAARSIWLHLAAELVRARHSLVFRCGGQPMEGAAEAERGELSVLLAVATLRFAQASASCGRSSSTEANLAESLKVQLCNSHKFELEGHEDEVNLVWASGTVSANGNGAESSAGQDGGHQSSRDSGTSFTPAAASVSSEGAECIKILSSTAVSIPPNDSALKNEVCGFICWTDPGSVTASRKGIGPKVHHVSRKKRHRTCTRQASDPGRFLICSGASRRQRLCALSCGVHLPVRCAHQIQRRIARETTVA
jgi:hypothetical protein